MLQPPLPLTAVCPLRFARLTQAIASSVSAYARSGGSNCCHRRSLTLYSPFQDDEGLGSQNTSEATIMAHNPEHYNFELIDLMRRIVLTGWVLLIDERSEQARLA